MWVGPEPEPTLSNLVIDYYYQDPNVVTQGVQEHFLEKTILT